MGDRHGPQRDAGAGGRGARAHPRRGFASGSAGHAAEHCHVIYGGSVKPDNMRELAALPDVDGALVGGASLELRSFFEIVSRSRDGRGLAQRGGPSANALDLLSPIRGARRFCRHDQGQTPSGVPWMWYAVGIGPSNPFPSASTGYVIPFSLMVRSVCSMLSSILIPTETTWFA